MPLSPNLDPKPFEASLIVGLFHVPDRDTQAGRDALSPVDNDTSAALELDLRDTCLDATMNGIRDEGEDLMVIGANTLFPGRDFANDAGLPVTLAVRFDRAGVDRLVACTWACTWLLSGFSELVLAFDPTEPVETVMPAHEKWSRSWATRSPAMP